MNEVENICRRCFDPNRKDGENQICVATSISRLVGRWRLIYEIGRPINSEPKSFERVYESIELCLATKILAQKQDLVSAGGLVA